MSEKATLKKGFAIMLDGPDGVGKTTQLALARESLEQQGYIVDSSRVHGGSPFGEALRSVTLSDIKRPAMADLHIFIAMYYAMKDELDTQLAQGHICLIDRSPLSIIGYQVYGSGLDETSGREAAELAMKLINPDLIICYQAPPAVLDRRLQKRLETDSSASSDYFEQQPGDYLSRVAKGYDVAARLFSAEIVDASGSITDVHEATMAAIAKLF